MSNKYNLLVFIAIAVITFSSCKTHERCPAYGKVSTPKTTELKSV